MSRVSVWEYACVFYFVMGDVKHEINVAMVWGCRVRGGLIIKRNG